MIILSVFATGCWVSRPSLITAVNWDQERRHSLDTKDISHLVTWHLPWDPPWRPSPGNNYLHTTAPHFFHLYSWMDTEDYLEAECLLSSYFLFQCFFLLNNETGSNKMSKDNSNESWFYLGRKGRSRTFFDSFCKTHTSNDQFLKKSFIFQHWTISWKIGFFVEAKHTNPNFFEYMFK